MAAKEQAKPTRQKQEKPAEGRERKSILKRWSDRHSIPMKRASYIFVIVALLVATGLFIADRLVTHGYLRMGQVHERYIIAQQSATNLEIGSDVLTSAVRNFVVTGDTQYLQEYFNEANVTRRRDEAVDNLETMMSRGSAAYGHLSTALSLSNELMLDEYQAMKLILSTGNYDEALIPDVIKETELNAGDAGKSTEEKRLTAFNLVYGDRYEDYKTRIRSNTALCTQELIEASERERVAQDNRMNLLLGIQTVLTVAMLAVVLLIVLFISGWIRRPLSRKVARRNCALCRRPTIPSSRKTDGPMSV